MRKSFLVFLTIGFLVFGAVGFASATLVGDNVTSQHYFSDLSSPYQNLADAIVVDGTGDTMYPHSGTWYNVNVDASSFYVDFVGSATWSSGVFNGVVVDSLDDSSGNDLLGVSILTNMAGWDLSRLSFDADIVRLNWNNLGFTSNTYFDVDLDFGAAPVPEPSTILLLGGGLLGLGWYGRKRKK